MQLEFTRIEYNFTLLFLLSFSVIITKFERTKMMVMTMKGKYFKYCNKMH